MNWFNFILFIIFLTFVMYLINIWLVRFQCKKIWKEVERHGVQKDFLQYVDRYSNGISSLKMDVVYHIALHEALAVKED